MLPSDFPAWRLVYYYFIKWKTMDGTTEEIHEVLRGELCLETGTQPLIDSQSVKTTRGGGEERGYDGGKRVKGRK